MMTDVAIVGGGAAGVLTAIHLLRAARSGLRIVLIEKSDRRELAQRPGRSHERVR